jgi:hypothetical protein
VFHHVAGTFQQTDSSHIAMALYVDGLLKNSGTFPGNLTNTWNETPLTIGASFSSGEFLVGKIDEVSIYNRVLSTSEIQGIYTAGGAGKCWIDPGLKVLITRPDPGSNVP